MWKINWLETMKASASTKDNVDSKLSELQQEFQGGTPVLVVVESSTSGNSLAILLGKKFSLLNFISGSGDPPYYTSLGSGTNNKLMTYDFMGHHSESPMLHAIPMRDARLAMQHFLKTDTMSPAIQWEQD